ncbi:homoserine dehydrogenase [Streptomyces sp. NL15-2K]|uniref:homoserine dehydrogenase n=1 Tax=Streptomyces sp. NL15-2K TaxID=376149 RepID=UPI000F579E19|nr:MULTISPECIES: homoserine dehydrogenase [Actinomycetes]WKX12617.1 homoserine dehydrogenase [Kutzneria buriramensis]GCB43179.1 homoserine dehydrogenase [Streptomyces sp. NL15-2K]
MRNRVRIGLLGCGTVGEEFAELLVERRAAIEEVAGVSLELVRVAVRDPGKPRSPVLDPEMFTGDAYEVVKAEDVDVVVELIGGTSPAGELVTAALHSGKSVVTANKELVADAGPELFAAADRAGADLFFEAAAVAAVPILRPMRESLLAEDVTRVAGIVNGTTNFVLTRMTAEGLSFDEALAKAQELGYAEPEASADIEGTDAASKIAILASLAFNRSVLADDVSREGIVGLDREDFELASRFGFDIKLLGVAERFADGSDAHGTIGAQVFPALIARDHPLASVRDSFNAVFITTSAAGELMFYGHGAGPRPSASAILGDVVGAADQRLRGTHHRVPVGPPAAMRPTGELVHSYYIRADVDEAPGVLSEVTGVFGRHGVSIRTVDQHGAESQARIVFITFPAPEHALHSAMDELRGLGHVRGVGRVLRIYAQQPESHPGTGASGPFRARRTSQVTAVRAREEQEKQERAHHMSQPIQLVIHITTLPGRGKDQIAAFEHLAPLVRAEAGCLQYDLHQVSGDPDRFVLMERWSSQEALSAHDATPHMIEADTASPAFRAGPAEVFRLDAEPLA